MSNHYSVEDPSPAIQKFVNDFKARYNVAPDALAALGYDAMRVLADSINAPAQLKDPSCATRSPPLRILRASPAL